MKLSSIASTSRLSEIAGDLKACENEPLQFIGQIQSFGALVAFTVNDQRVQTASENIGDFLGQRHESVLGSKLSHLVGDVNAEMILMYCRDLTTGSSRISFSLEMGERNFDATVFTTDGLHFIEFEPSSNDADDLQFRFTQENEIKKCLIEMRNSKNVQAQAFAVCRAIQKITGMDRVMMYQFIAPHMHGEVIAEHRTLVAHSFMSHRFPASDIPRIARDLYLRNGLRVIPNIETPTYNVRPSLNPLTGQQLDLSDSRLRAVSPIHIEYLRNMKVSCSFSIAVVIEGKLWGLIACHNLKPLRVSVSQRTACEVIANAFGGMAGTVETSEKLQRRIQFDRKVRTTLDHLIGVRDPVDELMKSN